jgi:hypothetical protein
LLTLSKRGLTKNRNCGNMYNVVETAEKKPKGTFDRGSSLWYNGIDSEMVGRLISLPWVGEKI